MSYESREHKELQQQMQAKNKHLCEMNDAEFAAEFDRLTDDQAKKALQQLQQKTENGNANNA